MTLENIPQSPEPFEEKLTLGSDQKTSINLSGLDPGQEEWESSFQRVFEHAVDAYEKGVRESDQMFCLEEKFFLESIGATPQEIFDFVEDWAEDGVPTPKVIREVTGLRREYFLKVQDGQSISNGLISKGLPSPSASLGGHRWLPRIIAKARAKLRGELPPDIMYGCGMDRPFLRGLNIGLSEFLREVWEAGEDDEKILNYVNKKKRGI